VARLAPTKLVALEQYGFVVTVGEIVEKPQALSSASDDQHVYVDHCVAPLPLNFFPGI
jgi:hypothetical protein